MIWKQIEDAYWLLTEQGYFSLEKLVDQINTYSADQIKAMGDFDDDDDDEFDGYGHMVTQHGPLAVINVEGRLFAKEDWIDRYLGITSYPAIINALNAAKEHPDVEAAVLNMNTPGGSAAGCDECAQEVRRIDREEFPVYAYNSGQMNSGGMWLGSAARRIGCGRMSTAGSIGVLFVHTDVSEMLANQGIKKNILTIGDRKADGNPYQPLSEPARNTLISEMEQVFEVFGGTVAEFRSIPYQDIVDQQAQVYMGQSALEHGLVDVISPMNRFLESVATEVSGSSSFGPAGGRAPNMVTTMAKKSGASVSKTGTQEKGLSEAQKAAIAAGRPEEEVLADESLQAGESEESSQEEESSGEAGEGGQGDGSEESGSGSDDSEAGSQASAETSSGADTGSALDRAYDKLAEVMAERAELKAQVSSLESKNKAQNAQVEQLKNIAIERIHTMQVATGTAPSELGDASADTVVAQHERTVQTFNDRFQVGQKSKSPGDKNLHQEESVETTQPPNMARLNAVRINSGGKK